RPCTWFIRISQFEPSSTERYASCVGSGKDAIGSNRVIGASAGAIVTPERAGGETGAVTVPGATEGGGAGGWPNPSAATEPRPPRPTKRATRCLAAPPCPPWEKEGRW